MFAVIKTGGKQYRVAENDVLKIEKLDAEPGTLVEFAEVMMIGEGADATIGSPTVEGALVTAEVMDQGRSRKVIAFKKRRRQNSKRKRGHRQHYTEVQILEVLAKGSKPSKKASGEGRPKNRSNGGLSLAAKAGITAAAVAGAAAIAGGAAAVAKATSDSKKKADKSADKGTDDYDASKENGVEKKAAPGDGPLFTAPAGEPDDLTKVKGIGKVADRQLKEQGITTFAQLAALTDADIEKVDEYMPFSAAQITDWKAQADKLKG